MTPTVRRLLLSKGGHGIFNVRYDISACCELEGDTAVLLYYNIVLLVKEDEGLGTPSRPGIEPLPLDL